MSIRTFFKPVDTPTATDTYLEIGRLRWEGWPATIIASAVLTGPLYLALLVIVVVGLLT